MSHKVFLTYLFFIHSYGFIFISANPNLEHIPEEINRCLSADKHKLKPMPNTDTLAGECKPWTERSCCDNDRATAINSEDIFDLDKNLCANMSEKCQKYFRKETCFFECSPNIGLWFEKLNASEEYQRFRDVPLCKKDCDDWYQACANDMTCTENWFTNEEKCTENKKCKEIGKMYKSAKDFCEKVWDNGYKVMENNERCMTFSFDSKNNPNEEVALRYYEQKNSSPRLIFNHIFVFLVLALALAPLF